MLVIDLLPNGALFAPQYGGSPRNSTGIGIAGSDRPLDAFIPVDEGDKRLSYAVE